MFNAGNPAKTRILVVRLGSMGDIIHTLPAVASLKHSHPASRLTWAVEPRWALLLAENPFVDRLVTIRRDSPGGMIESFRALRAERYDFAVDFQGLLKSALVASLALRSFPLPPGEPQGDLPPGDFVLASPLAGWPSKQWPLEHYRALAVRLGRELAIPLVLDGPPGAGFTQIPEALTHTSGLPGLIYATRRAAAVIGVDS